jgi:hypothetical protein
MPPECLRPEVFDQGVMKAVEKRGRIHPRDLTLHRWAITLVCFTPHIIIDAHERLKGAFPRRSLEVGGPRCQGQFERLHVVVQSMRLILHWPGRPTISVEGVIDGNQLEFRAAITSLRP